LPAGHYLIESYIVFSSTLCRATGEQLRQAKTFAHQLRTRGILGDILLSIGFISYIVQKHKK
jgi:Ribonuclease G/E